MATQLALVRRFVTYTVTGWGLESHDVVQVANELAANAIVHAGTTFTVDLRRDGHQVRVEVTDLSSQLPVVADPASGDTSGRGLPIVATLSTAWGVHRSGEHGKAVWATVPTVSPTLPGQGCAEPTTTLARSTGVAGRATPRVSQGR